MEGRPGAATDPGDSGGAAEETGCLTAPGATSRLFPTLPQWSLPLKPGVEAKLLAPAHRTCHLLRLAGQGQPEMAFCGW